MSYLTKLHQSAVSHFGGSYPGSIGFLLILDKYSWYSEIISPGIFKPLPPYICQQAACAQKLFGICRLVMKSGVWMTDFQSCLCMQLCSFCPETMQRKPGNKCHKRGKNFPNRFNWRWEWIRTNSRSTLVMAGWTQRDSVIWPKFSSDT